MLQLTPPYYVCVMIDVKQHVLNVHYHMFLDQPFISEYPI